MTEQTIPQDILDYADKLYPQIVRLKDAKIVTKEGKSDYIQGRLDERNMGDAASVNLQQIAIELSLISWVTVQCDDIHESYRVVYLLNEIEKLPKEDGLRLMLHVIEVKSLMLETDGWDEYNPFREMSKFPNIDSTIKNFPTDDFKMIKNDK